MENTHPSAQWRYLLWFWTVQWRWSAQRQRAVLAWWQGVGWDAGWELLLHQSSSLSKKFQDSRWRELHNHLKNENNEGRDAQFYWVTLVDPLFPAVLRQYETAPTVLWSNRPWEAWDGVMLAVVGSRQSTAYGRLAVHSLIPRFALHYQALIVSGGARGIDQAAHDAALEVRQPTWVVVGCGLAYVSPSLKRFRENPARLVSPFPPQDVATKWTFPARNQVIAQLSAGVLIVEAASGSGSLITAAAALEFGKELMVVLPPFTSPNSAGALRLLRQGAHPVATWQDIAKGLGLADWESKNQSEKTTPPPSYPESCVLQILEREGGVLRWGELTAQLMQQQRIAAATVNSWITTLELRGKVRVELGVVRLSGMIQS